mmetsp:Transcript_38201/g.65239  ORF Transcript_38201/g.65239 Transcript_38201/m.65239 type:complete len:93 (+) Transcript_38201:88-366(+)
MYLLYFQQQQRTPLIHTNNNSPPPSSCQWRPKTVQGICGMTKSTPQSQIYKTALECEEASCKSKDRINFQLSTKEIKTFNKVFEICFPVRIV